MPCNLPNPLPRRLNLGCGYDIRPGYLNVDFVERHAPDFVADVTNLPMLPNRYFDEIIAQDVWEHFERDKTRPALAEWARLLSDSGFLWVRIPSMLHLAEMLVAAEEHGPDKVRAVLHLVYGTQAYPGDYHLTGFTSSVLADLFSSVELVITEVYLYQGWLYEITARRRGVPVSNWPVAQILNAAAVACLITECEQLRAEIAAIRASTSWRITAPFRRVIQAIKTPGR
jgi:hypothetical protein